MVERLNSRWWLWPLAIFLASRLVSGLILLVASYLQGANYWTGAHPDYFSFLNIWDVEWYGRIVKDGYPTVLPVDSSGHVGQNAWAFLPLFPYLVKATFLPWKFGAPILATVFALLFALVAHRLFVKVLGDGAKANWALAFVLTWAASPVLQTGYAESLSLLGIALVLYSFLQKRYWVTSLALVVVGFSRPGVLAFALFFAIVLVQRWLVRNREEFLLPEAAKLVALGVWSLLLGLAWPWIAGLATGRSDAYLATELAWRAGYVADDQFTPFSGFIVAFQNFFGGFVGVLIFVILVGNLVYLFFAKSVRAIGALAVFSGSYLLYLFATFYPQSSSWRLLLPVFGLAAALASKASPRWRWAILVVFVLSQVFWVATCWMYAEPDFTPP